MKKTDYFFWTALILIALFYIFKGNDMHDNRFEFIKKDNTEIIKED